jgi:hypothetical protein
MFSCNHFKAPTYFSHPVAKINKEFTSILSCNILLFTTLNISYVIFLFHNRLSFE